MTCRAPFDNGTNIRTVTKLVCWITRHCDDLAHSVLILLPGFLAKLPSISTHHMLDCNVPLLHTSKLCCLVDLHTRLEPEQNHISSRFLTRKHLFWFATKESLGPPFHTTLSFSGRPASECPPSRTSVGSSWLGFPHMPVAVHALPWD